MHKRRVLYLLEPKVETILRRRLAREGYRILTKVHLADAIGKNKNDRLSQRDFGYYTRAHFDFLVTKDYLPVFALELDVERGGFKDNL